MTTTKNSTEKMFLQSMLVVSSKIFTYLEDSFLTVRDRSLSQI